MGRFSELQQELVRSEHHLAESQARIARQAAFVRELYADGHDTTFAAKRLFVLAANLNGMARQRAADRARAVGGSAGISHEPAALMSSLSWRRQVRVALSH